MTDNLDERKTFCSAKGVTLNLRPVSQFKLDAVRKTDVEIPVPQYQMTIAGGEKVNHPMDETIARNQNRMDEWLAYKKAVQEQGRKQAERFSELLIFEGIDIEVPGEDSEWQKNSERFGIAVPTDPIARKMQYVYNEFLVGPDDVVALVSQIMSVSQIPEEEVAKIRNSFRSPAQRNTPGRTGKDKRKVAKQQPDVQ